MLATLEDFSKQLKLVLRQICEFLGIRELPYGSLSHKSSTVDSIRRLHPLLKALASSRFANLTKAIVPKNLRRSTKGTAMVKYQVQGRYKLNSEEGQAILEKLAPGLRRLSSHFGIDVEKKWGIKLCTLLLLLHGFQAE